MDERRLKHLLEAAPRPDDRPRFGCPGDEQLAAYADGRAPSDATARIETHLADCVSCLEQVSFLVRRQEHPGESSVPPALLSRARDLVAGSQPSRLAPAVRWAGLAAAACLALAVGLQVRATRTSPDAGMTPDAAASTPAAPEPAAPAPTSASQEVPAGTTSATSTASDTAQVAASSTAQRSAVRAEAEEPDTRSSITTPVLTLLSPVEGGTFDASKVAFTWRPFPGALYYDVEVMTEKGDVVWQHRTDTTAADVSFSRTPLSPARYFVTVRAHLAGGATVRSAAVSFRVGAS